MSLLILRFRDEIKIKNDKEKKKRDYWRKIVKESLNTERQKEKQKNIGENRKQ